MCNSNLTNQKKIVELKTRVGGLATVRDKLVQCGAVRLETLRQIDTYYEVPKGRLKFREIQGEADGKLVYYERENVAEIRESFVFIVATYQPQAFKQVLERILTIKAVVAKTREVYILEGVRVHLDEVDTLGSFVEFELATSMDSKQQGRDLRKLEELGGRLGVNLQNLEHLSYGDLV